MDLAMHFRNPLSPNPCRCHHDTAISNADSTLGLRQELFQGASNAGCDTHHHFHLWQKLQDIQPFQSYDCTMDLILAAANKYPSAKSDPCTCTGELPTTSSSTTKTTTTHTTTTTTRTMTTTTTTVSPFPPNRFRCRKYELIADIAIGNHVHTNGSTPCESKLSGTNEDLVISLCNMTSVETWSRGAQVMSNCEVIPSYSPVATFSLAGKYQPLDSQSGVFLECLGSDGFKMIIQSCNGGPQIIHVQTNGVFNNNATIYYAVV